jgi:putative transcriptional regulator
VKLDDIRKRIAGDIIYSNSFSSAFKKWRETFKIPQKALAKYLRLSPSVISDYEKGRRSSPGMKTIRKMIDAMIEIDQLQGSPTIEMLSMLRSDGSTTGIIKIVEFPRPVKVETFCKRIDAKLIVNYPSTIHGCTVIDSEKAIVEMSAEDFMRFFGEFPQRALIFTNVRSGKSVMVAVKVGRLYAKMIKPRLVVFHKPVSVSEVAIKIAKSEHIALATTDVEMKPLLERIK